MRALWLPSRALLGCAGLVGAWQVAASTGALADALHLEAFLVPSPAEIASSLWENRSLLAENAWVTLKEVLLGFGCALVAGLALRRRPAPLRDPAARLLPAARRLADDPDRRHRPDPRRLVRLRDRPEAGDRRPDLLLPDHRQRARRPALGRPRGDQDDAHPRRLPLADPSAGSRRRPRCPTPSAAPRSPSPSPSIGAVFGEWAGSDSGLGHLMLQDNAQLETARLFAAVVVLSAMAIALFGLLALAERRIVTWR